MLIISTCFQDKTLFFRSYFVYKSYCANGFLSTFIESCSLRKSSQTAHNFQHFENILFTLFIAPRFTNTCREFHVATVIVNFLQRQQQWLLLRYRDAVTQTISSLQPNAYFKFELQF